MSYDTWMDADGVKHTNVVVECNGEILWKGDIEETTYDFSVSSTYLPLPKYRPYIPVEILKSLGIPEFNMVRWSMSRSIERSTTGYCMQAGRTFTNVVVDMSNFDMPTGYYDLCLLKYQDSLFLGKACLIEQWDSSGLAYMSASRLQTIEPPVTRM